MTNKQTKKGQVAIEYMLVLALGMFLLLASLYVFFSYSASTNSKVAYAQVESAGNSILLGAEKVAGLSKGSWTTVMAKIPENVHNITIHNNGDPSAIKELIFNTETGTSDAEVVLYTHLPIVGAHPVPGIAMGDFLTTTQPLDQGFPGSAKFKITSYGTNITIERIS